MPVTLSRVKVNGKAVPKDALWRISGHAVGVHLGDLKRGTSVDVEASYLLTGDFANLHSPSLRVEICRSEREALCEATDSNDDGDNP